MITAMKSRFVVLALALGSAASAEDPKLRGGNILACETWSFRDLIRSGKLDIPAVPAFYKEQGIPGISYNDMLLQTTDDAYIDEVKAAVKAAGRVVASYVIEGSRATA